MELKPSAHRINVPYSYVAAGVQFPGLACGGGSNRGMGDAALHRRRWAQRQARPRRCASSGMGSRHLAQFGASEPERAPRKGRADPLVDRTWVPILYCVGSDPTGPQQTVRKEGTGGGRLLPSEVGGASESLGGSRAREGPGDGFSGRGGRRMEDAETLLARSISRRAFHVRQLLNRPGGNYSSHPPGGYDHRRGGQRSGEQGASADWFLQAVAASSRLKEGVAL